MNVLLGLTGSVAALKAPQVCDALLEAGHTVRCMTTEPALHFVDPEEIIRRGVALFRDRDEWPEARWQREDPVLHVELRRWAEALVLAPLDANTLGKVAHGLADNLVTSVVRVWDPTRPVLLAPAMNTLMWESAVTRRHFGLLLELHGRGAPPPDWSLADVAGIFRHFGGLWGVAPPRETRLACGDFGMGAMAEPERIVAELAELQGRVPSG